MAEDIVCPSCGVTKTDADPNCDCSLTGARCEDCDTALTEATTFTHQGFTFCTNCVSAVASWYLDGGETDDPNLFAYLRSGDSEKVSHGR